MDRLPKVPTSNGHRSVSPCTSVTRPGGTASSSATSRRNAVWLSWPMSTLPVNAITAPDGATASRHRRRSATSRRPAWLAARPPQARRRGCRTSPAGRLAQVSGAARPGQHRPCKHRSRSRRFRLRLRLRLRLARFARQLGGPVHGPRYPRVAAAPADIRLQRRGDLLAAWIRHGSQQRRGSQRHARRAVAALADLLFRPPSVGRTARRPGRWGGPPASARREALLRLLTRALAPNLWFTATRSAR